jgi:hypothetical protein
MGNAGFRNEGWRWAARNVRWLRSGTRNERRSISEGRPTLNEIELYLKEDYLEDRSKAMIVSIYGAWGVFWVRVTEG